jgi:hypothetical protein
VGTCVTGTTGLALHTGGTMFHWAAVACYAGLLAAWIMVASRTRERQHPRRALPAGHAGRHGGGGQPSATRLRKLRKVIARFRRVRPDVPWNVTPS